MTPTTAEQYLLLLRTELRGLPRDRRREILAQVDEHITAYRTDAGVEGEQDIAAVLERLGDPAEIGAEARDRFGIQPRRPGTLEVIVLLLVGFGPALVLLPLIASGAPTGTMVVGLTLLVSLWSSRFWSVRDKLIGTVLLTAGTVALPFMLHLYDHNPQSSGALLITILITGAAPFFATATFLWVRMRQLAPHRTAALEGVSGGHP
jgi:uncharacterized membrane protein